MKSLADLILKKYIVAQRFFFLTHPRSQDGPRWHEDNFELKSNETPADSGKALYHHNCQKEFR